MGDGPSRADDESWTETQDVQPELVEAVPIRHGMVLAGRYAIERIIGRGGSGVVVRAHDRDLRVAVAIKIVRAELAGQRVWAGRLAREVKLARQIHHPHVCRVFDFQQADGRVFLVMELAEKGTLRDEIRSGALAARPLAERIADARAVASALSAIHAAGIVHRDLSLQNLLRMDDGRLVLSDFGLAVDVSDSTSSVHGGTVAYMAPEVVRGDKASVASDIWALGVVMHEMVFGVKPLWAGAESAEMREPDLGRRLSEEERAVLETCRACTAREPARRIASAAGAGRLLTERRPWWRWRRAISVRRPVMWAGALALAAMAAVGVVRVKQKAPGSAAPSMPELRLIVPTGEPADWTDVSTVLVEVPDRITCTRLLPDQRTIRFVWGTPPRAEDIDIVTRKRIPSPLVPAAYAEGCPDLSPDGRRLIYQGHTDDGRAFALLSEHPDGKDAVPVVPTAEPSMLSEPTWLADGQHFSYDVDVKHMGVFSTSAGRMYVLPEATARSFVTMFRFVIENRVFVATQFDSGDMEFAGFLVPDLKEETRFRLAEPGLDLTSGGRKLYVTSHGIVDAGQVTEIDVLENTGHRVGRIRGQFARHLRFSDSHLLFVSGRVEADLYLRDVSGRLTAVTSHARVVFAKHCGRDFVVTRRERDGSIVERIDAHGRVLRVLSQSALVMSAACSPDGRVWYLSESGSVATVKRCDESSCRDLVHETAASLSVSPDGSRLAFIVFEKRGPIVKWISAEGGEPHEASETETACPEGWATPQTLWVSRRRGKKFVWKEVDADSGRETGKEVPGNRDCSDGRLDSESPVDPDLTMVYEQTSQLRLLDRQFLRQR